MSEATRTLAAPCPTDRLNYSGDLTPVVEHVCEVYGIGAPNCYSVIDVGYEDCNVIIATEQGRFMAKMFAKTRTSRDIARYAEIIRKVVEAGVHHPEFVLLPWGEMLYKQAGIELVLLRFVEGKTFFELGRAPTEDERRAFIEQAAQINGINCKPRYVFDPWAIPNIGAMFDETRRFVRPADLRLVEKVVRNYNDISVDALPHAFVHGDMRKTNAIKADDGRLYVIDFSVSNWYPRIQELAIIATNLLHEDNGLGLIDRCEQVAGEYNALNPLVDQEWRHLLTYALAAVAIDFLGAHQQKYVNGNNGKENDYWLDLAKEELRRAFLDRSSRGFKGR